MEKCPMTRPPRRPRFVLKWQRHRSEPPIVVCWTWSRYRADVIAVALEWGEGRFLIEEEVVHD